MLDIWKNGVRMILAAACFLAAVNFLFKVQDRGAIQPPSQTATRAPAGVITLR